MFQPDQAQQVAALVSNPVLTDQIAQLQASIAQVVSIATHGFLGIGTAHFIDYLKGRPLFAKIWMLLSPRQKTIFGFIAALLGSLGVTATFSHPAGAPDGTFALVFTNLTTTSIYTHVSSLFQSWISQQGWYQAVLKPTPVPVYATPAPANPVAPILVPATH
jgi:hypothetical protein